MKSLKNITLCITSVLLFANFSVNASQAKQAIATAEKVTINEAIKLSLDNALAVQLADTKKAVKANAALLLTKDNAEKFKSTTVASLTLTAE